MTTSVLREKQNGSTARKVVNFRFDKIFLVLICSRITCKPNLGGRENKSISVTGYDSDFPQNQDQRRGLDSTVTERVCVTLVRV